MIDPRDIFNAHRVVGMPNQFRGKRPSRPPMILPQPSVIRSGERRGAALRIIGFRGRVRLRRILAPIGRILPPPIPARKRR